MRRVKNVSGETRSIPSIGGAFQIEAGAVTEDLTGFEDGRRRNFAGELDVSQDLEDALLSGDWLAVDDEGNELDQAASLDMFSPASIEQSRTFDGRTSLPWSEVLPKPSNNAWFDVLEIPVPDGGAVAVAVNVFVAVGDKTEVEVGSRPFVFAARRQDGDGAVAPRVFALEQSEGGIRFQIDDRAASVVLQAKRRGTNIVRVRYTGTAESITL